VSLQRTLLWTATGLAAAVFAARFWLVEEPPPPAAEPQAIGPPAAPGAPVSTPTEPPVAAEAPPTTAGQPALTREEVVPALVDLIGSKAVHALLQTDDFPRRIVATVDNLARSHAPPMVWPVHPTPGRFAIAQQNGRTVIDADNGLRYVPFVLLVETMDIARMVALYRRMSPLLQNAYEDLGYPGRSFEKRLIEVIDVLLATPDAPEPTPVMLVEVKGEVPSTRPWVRYEFVDPQLESLAAGQKILLRTGAVNQRRLKAKLAEIRSALLEGSPRR
jgi:Protein of unknown function (DUF3014)